MPASYAHYRFGKQVLSFLPADARQCVQRFRRMYDMGLQGPDIFFFYNPFLKTAVGTLDSTFHSQSGRDFFPAACVQATTEAARAYLYGLLAHYCLDSVSHAGLPHAEGSRAVPEAEFDRYLLELDSVPLPHTYDLSPKLKLTRGECMTVATFYPGATGGTVSLSTRNMALLCRLGAKPKRQRTVAVLKRLPGNLADRLIPEEPVEAFARMDSELLARFNRAVRLFPGLLEQLTEHMRTGEPLGEDFSADFG